MNDQQCMHICTNLCNLLLLIIYLPGCSVWWKSLIIMDMDFSYYIICIIFYISNTKIIVGFRYTIWNAPCIFLWGYWWLSTIYTGRIFLQIIIRNKQELADAKFMLEKSVRTTVCSCLVPRKYLWNIIISNHRNHQWENV